MGQFLFGINSSVTIHKETRHIKRRSRTYYILKASLFINDIFEFLTRHQLQLCQTLLSIAISCPRSDWSENLCSRSIKISFWSSCARKRRNWTASLCCSFEHQWLHRKLWLGFESSDILFASLLRTLISHINAICPGHVRWGLNLSNDNLLRLFFILNSVQFFLICYRSRSPFMVVLVGFHLAIFLLFCIFSPCIPTCSPFK